MFGLVTCFQSYLFTYNACYSIFSDCYVQNYYKYWNTTLDGLMYWCAYHNNCYNYFCFTGVRWNTGLWSQSNTSSTATDPNGYGNGISHMGIQQQQPQMVCKWIFCSFPGCLLCQLYHRSSIGELFFVWIEPLYNVNMLLWWLFSDFMFLLCDHSLQHCWTIWVA